MWRMMPVVVGGFMLLSVPLLGAELGVSVTSQGADRVNVPPGSTVPFDVTLVLSDTNNEGLCFFYVDLAFEGGPLDPVAAPITPPLTAFLPPSGVTNPDGYGGTWIDGVLRQVGGSQNTLKLNGPEPLPSGAVVTGVGHEPIIAASGSVAAPVEPGTYTLRVSKALGRAIQQGQDGSGPLWMTEWAFAGTLEHLTVTVSPCEVACTDADANGVRDDPCTWYSCNASECVPEAIQFADVGGPFGDCAPDGFTNLFDRSHVLTCFAGTNPCSALSIDAGGPFGGCQPDGFCNLFDVSHALTSFAGTNPCTCPPSPAPQSGPQEAVGAASLKLIASNRAARPTQMIEVDVFADLSRWESSASGLMGYQLDLGVSGGVRGRLELVDIRIDNGRPDFVFGQLGCFSATNAARGQAMVGLDRGGVRHVGEACYLATFVYRPSADAFGTFVVDARTSTGPGNQTFLLGELGRSVDMDGISPATVVVPTRKHPSRTGGRRNE